MASGVGEMDFNCIQYHCAFAGGRVTLPLSCCTLQRLAQLPPATERLQPLRDPEQVGTHRLPMHLLQLRRRPRRRPTAPQCLPFSLPLQATQALVLQHQVTQQHQCHVTLEARKRRPLVILQAQLTHQLPEEYLDLPTQFVVFDHLPGPQCNAGPDADGVGGGKKAAIEALVGRTGLV